MEHTRRLILPLVLTLLAAGCVSTSEQLAQRNNERCAARGLQPGSDRFSECLVQLEGERVQRMETHHRQMMERPPDVPGR